MNLRMDIGETEGNENLSDALKSSRHGTSVSFFYNHSWFPWKEGGWSLEVSPIL